MRRTPGGSTSSRPIGMLSVPGGPYRMGSTRAGPPDCGLIRSTTRSDPCALNAPAMSRSVVHDVKVSLGTTLPRSWRNSRAGRSMPR